MGWYPEGESRKVGTELAERSGMEEELHEGQNAHIPSHFPIVKPAVSNLRKF